MASINVTTNYIESSSPVYFFWSYTQIACRTTLANLGPLPNYTVPSTCQHTPLYSDLRIAGASPTTLFECPETLAYRSCMPTPYVGSMWTTEVEQQCDKTFTFHSPAWACPTGWTVGAEFTLKSDHNGREVTTTWSSAPVIPASMYPIVKGTHLLCCPR